MNNKGFTMVELLVAMAIMGLLIIMAFPTIRAVQTNNEKKKYEEYGKAVISASKLYVDSYGEDILDPDQNNQFTTIYINDLVQKDLIKDINVSGVSCINGETNVNLVKYNDDYAYCLHLKCYSGTTSVYETADMKGACKQLKDKAAYSVKVTYEYTGHKTESIDTLKGDDNYKILSPNKFGMDFNTNKDVFIEWVDTKDNKTYKPGDIYNKPIEENITLRAKTRKWKYLIYFNKGLADSGAMSKNPQECEYGKDCPLLANGFTKEGYNFDGWKDGNNNSYTNTENVKTRIGNNITKDGHRVDLTAKFKIKTYTVKIDSNFVGITSISLNNQTADKNKKELTATVNHGTSITLKASKSNYYKFLGWQDQAGTVQAEHLNSTITVKSNLHLTAKSRLSKIYVVYHYNGGVLKPGPYQKCSKEAGCKPGKCYFDPPKQLAGCTRGECSPGNVCYKTPGEDNYGYDHSWATQGLRNYKTKADATLYMTRSGYTATGYWRVGSENGRRINEKKKFNSDNNTGLLFLKTCYPDGSYTNTLKDNDVTVHLYADWKKD